MPSWQLEQDPVSSVRAWVLLERLDLFLRSDWWTSIRYKMRMPNCHHLLRITMKQNAIDLHCRGMGGEVDTTGQCCCTNENLDASIVEKSLDGSTIGKTGTKLRISLVESGGSSGIFLHILSINIHHKLACDDIIDIPRKEI